MLTNKLITTVLGALLIVAMVIITNWQLDQQLTEANNTITKHAQNVAVLGVAVGIQNQAVDTLIEETGNAVKESEQALADLTRNGTVNDDNPCGLFLPDGAAPSTHVSLVDCELLPTSTASMVVYFNVDNFVEENCYSSGVVFPTTNGSLISHTKGRCKNGTYRYINYSADSNNGLIWISNQGYADCENVEMQFFRLNNVGAGNGAPLRVNGQVHSAPMLRPPGMLIQRGSINGNDVGPFNFENYVGGYDVEYGGILWASSTASAIDSTGGSPLSAASVKVSNIDTLTAENKGKGCKIYSGLVT